MKFTVPLLDVIYLSTLVFYTEQKIIYQYIFVSCGFHTLRGNV